jgi:DNA-binding MarR family transcriptional regulator
MRQFPFGETDEADAERLVHSVPPEYVDGLQKFRRLAMCAADLLDYLQTVADQHGLPPARARALMALAFQLPEEGATPALLAEKLASSRSNITGLLDGLEREKLIERVHDRQDRRSVRLRLTKKGRALTVAFVPELAEATQRFIAALESGGFMVEETASKIEAALAQVSAGAEGD